MKDGEPTMPSEVSGDLGAFDRFATIASRFVSRAYFFVACVLLVLIWAPSYFLIGNVDTWQLLINTATTIVTFLMVALLQNSQTRADQAVQHKLNAIADALADLMDHLDDREGRRSDAPGSDGAPRGSRPRGQGEYEQARPQKAIWRRARSVGDDRAVVRLGVATTPDVARQHNPATVGGVGGDQHVPRAVMPPPPISVQRAPACSAIQPSSGAPIGVPPMNTAM